MLCSERAPERAMPNAGVVELVDTQDLGSCDASRGGSNPSARTSLLRDPALIRWSKQPD